MPPTRLRSISIGSRHSQTTTTKKNTAATMAAVFLFARLDGMAYLVSEALANSASTEAVVMGW